MGMKGKPHCVNCGATLIDRKSVICDNCSVAVCRYCESVCKIHGCSSTGTYCGIELHIGRNCPRCNTVLVKSGCPGCEQGFQEERK